MRPLLSSSTPAASEAPPRRSPPASRGARQGRTGSRRGSGSAASGLRVRRLARGADDGYGSQLLLGLRSSEEAARLSREIAFAARRLEILAGDPPGLYAVVAAPDRDLEERTWLAFLTAYLAPLEEPDPFTEINRVRTSWDSGQIPDLDEVRTGARTAHEPSRDARTLEAYRAWASRAGSQQAAFAGEPAWSPERRFDRAYERLALPGLHRAARFELLVTLGLLGAYELSADALKLGGNDEVTVAAKRALGIGDTMLLERRCRELAAACGVPPAALDLALYNWERSERIGAGVEPSLEAGGELVERIDTALGI